MPYIIGKMAFLEKFLKALRQDTEEKCVLVSHYTSTLNILEAFCRKHKYSYFRLDGCVYVHTLLIADIDT